MNYKNENTELYKKRIGDDSGFDIKGPQTEEEKEQMLKELLEKSEEIYEKVTKSK